MKRLILTAMLLLGWAAGASAAGDIIADFSARLASSCATFDYAFTLSTPAKVTGNGSVTYMSGRYHVTGNGLEVWCDGSTRWTIDHASKEAYMESVEDAGVDFLGNPALLLQAVGTMFTQQSQKSAVFEGKEVTAVKLVPAVKGTGLRHIILHFSSDQVPVGAQIVAEDGTSTTVSIKGFKYTEQASQSFTYDIGKLDKSYLITDLR